MKHYYKVWMLASIATLSALTTSAQRKDKVDNYSQYLTVVDEYMPAPGQFINLYPEYTEGDDAARMAEKCTDLLKGAPADRQYSLVSLGGFGGYITFHFDHSIVNIDGEKDFVVRGNAYRDGAEPGIVMVSRDTNGNGLPDDEWFELAGSVTSPTYNYTINYSRNENKTADWSDSEGQNGTITRVVEVDDGGNEVPYHSQEFYPMWIEDNTYTLRGTRLPNNGVQTSGSLEYWTLSSYDWGYADNHPATDQEQSSFDISWAVDKDRKPVNLEFIDFVRVYTALNQECGWLGETSTEVTGAWDLHTDESLSAIDESLGSCVTFEDINLVEDSFWNGSDMTGEQTTDIWGSDVYKNTYYCNGFRFTNIYNPAWGSWSGFAISNKTDNTYVDYTTSQYNNCLGYGYDNSKNFAVVFPSGNNEAIDIDAEEGMNLTGFYLTNSAWNVDAYINGDGMTDGGFTNGDWCKLTIYAVLADNTTSMLDVYLADYRSDDASEHYYIKEWQWVDLSSLGKVASLSFGISSSRNNDWGMTTPGYFCMDNFNGVADETAINEYEKATTNVATEVARYSVDGKLLSTPQSGLNIIRMSDGTVRKVFVK